MERERLGRGLSLVCLGLGSIMSVLSIVLGQTTGAVLGVLGVFAGVTCYRMSDQLFDTDSITSDSADTRRMLTVNLLQLGLVLLVFAFTTYLFSDIELLVDSFQTGLQAPTYPAYIGVIIGLFLGGGMALLSFRWKRLQNASQSVPFRMVGFSVTFGTYLLLLLSQLPAALVYATAYTLSRLLALFGIASLSHR